LSRTPEAVRPEQLNPEKILEFKVPAIIALHAVVGGR
jgi:hypothetical protein